MIFFSILLEHVFIVFSTHHTMPYGLREDIFVHIALSQREIHKTMRSWKLLWMMNTIVASLHTSLKFSFTPLRYVLLIFSAQLLGRGPYATIREHPNGLKLIDSTRLWYLEEDTSVLLEHCCACNTYTLNLPSTFHFDFKCLIFISIDCK